MGKIFCLLGKSGAGKDTVFEALAADKTLGLGRIITYTTRPMRDGEFDGEQYRFVTKAELDAYAKSGRLIELRRYDTIKGVWYYGTVDDGQINLTQQSYLMILTPNGYAALKRRFGPDDVVPIYIEVEDGERLERALRRERESARPDYKEMCRRFLADCDDFSDEKLKKAGVTKRYVNDDIINCTGLIKRDIIRKMEQQ